jgi:transposase
MRIGEITSKRLDHHGIVAGVIEDLGLIGAIDARLGSSSQETLSAGQAVAGMILNGLGFSDRPLSLTPQFFEQIPVDRLFGDGVTAADFNRYKLGRTLDALYDTGLSSLFSELASVAVAKEGVDCGRQALDTTTFSLEGSYDQNSDSQGVRITHGYSKDRRPDLQQVVAELIVSHDAGIPLMLQCHDGNASDSMVFKERCKQLVEQFDPGQLLVADSKLYCQENIENLRKIGFVTRIPESLKEAKSTIIASLQDTDGWHKLPSGEGTQENLYYSHSH